MGTFNEGETYPALATFDIYVYTYISSTATLSVKEVEVDEQMVLRSVNLWSRDDSALRQFAFDQQVTKSDLIRAAIRAKLREWRGDNAGEILRNDLDAAKQP